MIPKNLAQHDSPAEKFIIGFLICPWNGLKRFSLGGAWVCFNWNNFVWTNIFSTLKLKHHIENNYKCSLEAVIVSKMQSLKINFFFYTKVNLVLQFIHATYQSNFYFLLFRIYLHFVIMYFIPNFSFGKPLFYEY